MRGTICASRHIHYIPCILLRSYPGPLHGTEMRSCYCSGPPVGVGRYRYREVGAADWFIGRRRTDTVVVFCMNVLWAFAHSKDRRMEYRETDDDEKTKQLMPVDGRSTGGRFGWEWKECAKSRCVGSEASSEKHGTSTKSPGQVCDHLGTVRKLTTRDLV